MSSSLLLYSRAYSRHTEYVVMITNGGSTKIINFMTPSPLPPARVVLLGHGQISHTVKMHNFFSTPMHRAFSKNKQGSVYQNNKFPDLQGDVFLC